MSDTLSWADVDRHRLVRLCALISGSWAAAEDLAQETLLEACRNAHKVSDPSGRDRWLTAVARNVCRRWARSEASRSARRADLTDGPEVADPFDIEVELERDELAGLLDRALALLPEPTRLVLLRRYVDELSPADIAADLGVSADAVSMRISRGKLLLRRVLETELRQDAEAYGFVRPSDAGWRPTSVWCSQCGRGKLSMSVSAPDGSMSFRCAACHPTEPVLMSYYAMSNPSLARLLGPVARPTAIVGRAAGWVHDYFFAGVRSGSVQCTRCGRRTALRHYVREEEHYTLGTRRGVYAVCDACGEESCCSLGGMALSLPEVRRFRRSHPRIRALPERHVERAGRQTLVLGFSDMAARNQVDVLLDDRTLALRGVVVSHH
jgi:RNA polymerase sigma factor (sigma-70 family)